MSASRTGQPAAQDPLATVAHGSVTYHARRFEGVEGADLTPGAAGLYAGLERLETILQTTSSSATAAAAAAASGGKGSRSSSSSSSGGGGAPTGDASPAPPSPTPDPHASAVAARLRECLRTPLFPQEADALCQLLEAAPAITLTSGVTPPHVASLVALNPAIAVSFLACLARVAPPHMLLAYLTELLPAGEGRGADSASSGSGGGGGGGSGGSSSAPAAGTGSSAQPPSTAAAAAATAGLQHKLTLRNLEVVYSLLCRTQPALGQLARGGGAAGAAPLPPLPPLCLPPSASTFFHRHLSAAMASVPNPPHMPAARSHSSSSHAAALPPIYVRQVMLLCLYIRAVLDTEVLAGSDLLVEAMAFSLAHSAVGDAAQLYRALIKRKQGGV